jgi:hypothetical protein
LREVKTGVAGAGGTTDTLLAPQPPL